MGKLNLRSFCLTCWVIAMADQASKLREIFAKNDKGSGEDPDEAGEKAYDRSRIISVASGKGGVGKTNLVVNIGLALQKSGKEVLILDADMGMANVDVLLGLTSRYHLGHVLKQKCELEDALINGPEGITVLPGASGIDQFIDINMAQIENLLELSASIEKNYDFILMDIGAGAHKGVVNFIRAADEIMIILTPEPTAVMDAYSLLKILSNYEVSSRLNLIINQVESKKEAKGVTERMGSAIEEYLDMELDVSSYVPHDSFLPKAVRKQKPVMELYPNSRSGKAFSRIARNLLDEASQDSSRGMKGFVYRMLGFFKED